MVQDVSKPPPTRLALVTGGLTLGGSTTFLCNLGGELVHRGIPVEVLSFEKENPLGADFQRLKVPVFCQDERRVIFEDRMAACLERLGRFAPTVAVANVSQVAFEVLRYVPPGVFRVGVCHTNHPREYNTIRHYPGQLDVLAAVSQTVKAKLEAMPELAGVPVRYLPLGVPMPAEQARAHPFERPLRILYLGRLDREQKRAHLFPAIFERLRASGIPFHWTIAGDGAEREFLQQTMRSSGVEQTVSFTGQIAYAAVPQLLSQHHVFLLASDYEGLPLTLLEAMGERRVTVHRRLLTTGSHEPTEIPRTAERREAILVKSAR